MELSFLLELEDSNDVESDDARGGEVQMMAKEESWM